MASNTLAIQFRALSVTSVIAAGFDIARQVLHNPTHRLSDPLDIVCWLHVAKAFGVGLDDRYVGALTDSIKHQASWYAQGLELDRVDQYREVCGAIWDSLWPSSEARPRPQMGLDGDPFERLVQLFLDSECLSASPPSGGHLLTMT
jgi:hypothetical protein